MCRYCDPYPEPLLDDDNLRVVIEYGDRSTRLGILSGDAQGSTLINYCPVCGSSIRDCGRKAKGNSIACKSKRR